MIDDKVKALLHGDFDPGEYQTEASVEVLGVGCASVQPQTPAQFIIAQLSLRADDLEEKRKENEEKGMDEEEEEEEPQVAFLLIPSLYALWVNKPSSSLPDLCNIEFGRPESITITRLAGNPNLLRFTGPATEMEMYQLSLRNQCNLFGGRFVPPHVFRMQPRSFPGHEEQVPGPQHFTIGDEGDDPSLEELFS